MPERVEEPEESVQETLDQASPAGVALALGRTGRGAKDLDARASAFLDEQTELIVLVTPELVSPMEHNEVSPAPGDRVLQPNDWEFYFLGRIESKLGLDFRATVREHDPLDVMKHYRSEQQWVIGPHGYAD